MRWSIHDDSIAQDGLTMFNIAPVKQLIAMILAICLLAPMVMRDVILVNFFMNRDRIAKELCVEKDDAKSCCKGSCQLNKALHKVAEDETQDQLPATGKIEIFWYHTISEINCAVYSGSASAELDVYQEMQSCADLPVTDKPPSC